MESKKIKPKFNQNQNPKIGLIALASDYMIEKDFIKIIKDSFYNVRHASLYMFLKNVIYLKKRKKRDMTNITILYQIKVTENFYRK